MKSFLAEHGAVSRTKWNRHSRRKRPTHVESLELRTLLTFVHTLADLHIEAPGLPEGLDPDFYDHGRATVDFSSNTSGAYQALTLPDGEMLVAGLGSGTLQLAHFGFDGTLVSGTLDGDGTAEIPFGGSGEAVLFQSDGKIIVGGEIVTEDSINGDFDLAVWRFNSDGTPDTTFSEDGLATLYVTSGDDILDRLKIRSDGGLVLAGEGSDGGDDISFLVRFSADGTPDTNFNNNAYDLRYFIEGLAFQDDDKIVTGGEDFSVSRFNPDGTLDSTFGDAGIVTDLFPSSCSGYVESIAVQADGKIIAGGLATDNLSRQQMAIARFDTSGLLDSSFGNSGFVTTSLVSFPWIFGTPDLIVQPDGKIVALAGIQYTDDVLNRDMAMYRYFPNGTPDSDFGVGGVQIVDFMATNDTDEPTFMMRQPDGKFVVMGRTGDGTAHNKFAVARWGEAFTTTSGVPVTLNGVFTDLGQGNLTFTYEWRAYNLANPNIIVATGTDSSLTFLPGGIGLYGVDVVVTTNYGETKVVTVYIDSQFLPGNVSPEDLQITLDTAVIDESHGVTLSGTFFDWNTEDAHHVTVNWGDGQVSEFDLAPGETSFQSIATGHVYLDNPDSGSTFTITASVTDAAGSSSATIDVTVNNIAPVAVIAGAPASSPEGTAVNLNSASTDLSPIDEPMLMLSWRVTQNGLPYGSIGTGPVYSFTPNDNGTYVATLTATDKDNASVTTMRSISVTNVAPVAIAPLEQFAFNGNTALFELGSITDVGESDGPWHVTVSWGDATSASTFDVNSLGQIPSQSHPYNLVQSSAEVQVAVTDKDGLSGTTIFTIPINSAFVDSAVLIKDINLRTRSSSVSSVVRINSTVFFVADDGIHGNELWKSDGTEAGTVLVKDIEAGSGSSSPSNLTVVGTTLYFRASTTANGYELWKSDGTASGTVLVKDISAGSGSSNPTDLTVVGTTLYFRAFTTANGYELWKSNGTATGTVLVKDIDTGSGSSSPSNLTVVGTTLYFMASTTANGYELWKSNGTSAGTVLVKDIEAGSGSSYLSDLTVVGTTLYFQASTAANGSELWKSDGTATGTVLVKDIEVGSGSSSPYYLAVVGTTLYFTASTTANGYELWKSDGTAAGTVLVKDIEAGAGNSYPSYMTVVGTTLFFYAGTTANGYELWKSNGTAAGTILVKDISAGSGSSNPTDLTVVGTTLYFRASTTAKGSELWKSDGTAAGTVLVKDIEANAGSSYPSYLTVVGTTLFFQASTTENGNELWKSDGTASGTTMIADINQLTLDAAPAEFVELDGVTFFTATSLAGRELWKSDGTAAGTVLVKDIEAGAGSSSPSNLTVVGTMLYFRASTTANGYELWKSDGTAAGTVLVKDIVVGAGSSSAFYLGVVGTTLYFRAFTTANGYELWKSDGTAAGTVLVKDIEAGVGSSYPSNLTVAGTTLYFQASTTANGYELWKSGGTAAGTVLVKDIAAGLGSSYLTNLTVVGTTLYFTAYTNPNGYELWKSDGTATGTVLVKDIEPGSGSSYPSDLTVVGTMLYFQSYTAANGYELWKSDGSTAGTVLVKDIEAGSGPSYPDYLTVVGTTLYFRALTTANGYELWKSDGTAAGTVLVKDMNTGPGTSGIEFLKNINGLLYFGATDGLHGVELWKSPEIRYAVSVADDVALQAAIASTNRLMSPATPITVELNLTAGTYSDIVASPPKGVTLVIKGAEGGSTIIVGHSPALHVQSGIVIVEGVTLTTDTDSPTVVASGGDLMVRNSVVEESSGFDQPAIVADSDAQVDLGTPDSPGGNTFEIRGNGDLIQNNSGQILSAVGNTFHEEGNDFGSNFDIQAQMAGPSPVGGSGLVSFVANTLFVTNTQSDLQAAVTAAPAGFAIYVEAGIYSAVALGNKPLTLAFESGPTIALVVEGEQTNLHVTGTAGPDVLDLTQGATPDEVVVAFSGLPTIAVSSTGQIVASGGDGNDSINSNISNDLIADGGDGDDSISSGSGTTWIITGSGNDQVSNGTGTTHLVTNAAPQAVDDSYTTQINQPLTVAGPSVLSNDVPSVDGDSLSATLIRDVLHGQLTFQTDGSFTYTPETDFLGVDSFTYRAIGTETSPTRDVLVSIYVTVPNQPPIAESQSLTTDEDTPIDIVLTSFDPEGDPTTFSIVTAPQFGVLIGIAPNFTYVPNANFFGTDTFTFAVSDGENQSSDASITITAFSVNDAPVVEGGWADVTVNPGTANQSISLANAFADVDNPTLTYSAISSDGSLVQTVVDGSNLILTFALNLAGTSSVTVTATDAGGLSVSTTFTVTVNAVTSGSGMTLINGVLKITGTSGNDDLSINRVGDDYRVTASFADPGKTRFAVSSVQSIEIFILDRDDKVTIYSTVTVPVLMDGGSGNDTLRAGSGSTRILGGSGDDDLRGGDANDTIFGDDGDDLIHGGDGNDVIDGGIGNDEIQSGDGDDTITDSFGHNTIHAGLGNDLITTDAGNDRIWTNGGDDTIDAGDGDNEIHAASGNDTVITGFGNDRIWTDGGTDNIDAGDGDNEVYAGNGNNHILTGNGNDRICASGGDDVIDGGNGDNEIHAGSGNNQILTGSGNDEIWTESGDDRIESGDGTDTIYAGAGDDFILAGTGSDVVKGESGNDIVYAGEGNDEILGGAGDDELLGEAGDDILDGGNGDDILSGGSGIDDLKGGTGRDLLIGGLGADSIKGEGDDDILISNRVTFENDTIALRLVLAEWTSPRAAASRIANLQGTGFGPRLNGSTFLNSSSVLDDGAIDTLMGSSGLDWFLGSIGQDVFKDRNGNELVN